MKFKITHLFQVIKGIYRKYRDLFFLVSVIAILYLFLKRPSPTSSIVDTKPVLQKVEQLRDQNDIPFSKINQLILSLEQAKKENDSLAHALRLKPKFIKGQDLHTVITDTIVVSDTVYLQNNAFYAAKKDAHISIEVVKTTEDKQATFRINSKDTIRRTEVVKKHLFKPTERFITLQNTNRYNVITEGYSWKTVEKKPVLTLGVSVGWDIVSQRVIIGPTITKPLITFYGGGTHR